MRRAKKPPFPVGARVRYTGANRWSRYPGTSRPEGWPDVNPGDIGIVVRIVAGSDPTGLWLDEGRYHDTVPLHGYSVVQFHEKSHLTAAVDATSRDRYEEAIDVPA